MPEFAHNMASATQVLTDPQVTNHSKAESSSSWKDKLDLPEKDNRVKTAVSYLDLFTSYMDMYVDLMIWCPDLF